MELGNGTYLSDHSTSNPDAPTGQLGQGSSMSSAEFKYPRKGRERSLGWFEGWRKFLLRRDSET